MTDVWKPPDDHPISINKAKELLAGDLGDVYRDILIRSCAPIFWFRPNETDPVILHNGTLTLARTKKRGVFGITAAHVVREYEADVRKGSLQLQIMNSAIDDLVVIAISDRLDIATIYIDEELLGGLGKEFDPILIWRGIAPCEGRGIMLAGYPGIERLESRSLDVNFGLFTALGVARRVTREQITWLVERKFTVPNSKISEPPPNYDVGGVSGGPVIAWFETSSHIVTYGLVGIISQAHAALENIVAKQTVFIREDGTIQEPD